MFVKIEATVQLFLTILLTCLTGFSEIYYVRFENFKVKYDTISSRLNIASINDAWLLVEIFSRQRVEKIEHEKYRITRYKISEYERKCLRNYNKLVPEDFSISVNSIKLSAEKLKNIWLAQKEQKF